MHIRAYASPRSCVAISREALTNKGLASPLPAQSTSWRLRAMGRFGKPPTFPGEPGYCFQIDCIALVAAQALRLPQLVQDFPHLVERQ
mmetsp:Transcript_15060/g.38852  ORF Transcript_15060/g.38852 Transcript_15060/m.38852 type:complete len:88 (-) Transcript_15060:122-385(-)